MKLFLVVAMYLVSSWNVMPILAQDENTTTLADQPKAKKELTKYEKAAAAFKFQNFTLGMTLTQTKEFYPHMLRNDKASDAKLDREVFMVGKVKPASFVSPSFFEKKLYEIRVLYSFKELETLGAGEASKGPVILLNKLTERLGEFTKASPNQEEKSLRVQWAFPNANREVNLFVFEKPGNESFARIDIVDTTGLSKLEEKVKSAADTGF